MEVPVIPAELARDQTLLPTEASGDMQERGVARVAPGLFGSAMAVRGTFSTRLTSNYPGEFAFRTSRNYERGRRPHRRGRLFPQRPL